MKDKTISDISGKRLGISPLIIALLCGFSWLQTTVAAGPPGQSIFRINTQQKVIALTFDDGPNPESTGQIIELLKKYQARATFFVNGKNVRKYPEIVKTTYLAGNEIGNHAETHRRLIFKSPKEITREITATDQIIRETGYQGAIPFRAPYGRKLLILTRVLQKMHRKHIFWTFSLHDWDSLPSEVMFRRFCRKIGPGAIVLLHDGYAFKPASRGNTVKLVAMILEKYSQEGYRFVTVSELLAIEK